ncbi:MAG: hypothetical protein QXR73_01625 [Candidatus Micrarchaeaceae archaeon]
MELEKMTESEYKKYMEMNKAAYITRNRRIVSLAIALAGFTVFILLFYLSTTYLGHIAASTSPLLNYTNATVQNTHLNFTTNPAIAASITKLSQNPTLEILYLLKLDMLFRVLFTVIAAFALILIGIVFEYRLLDIANRIVIGHQDLRSYNGIKRALKEKDAIHKRLTEHGYTQNEIKWYFEVRSKMQELKNMVN